MSKTLRRVGRHGAVSIVLENVRRRRIAMERESAENYWKFDEEFVGQGGVTVDMGRLFGLEHDKLDEYDPSESYDLEGNAIVSDSHALSAELGDLTAMEALERAYDGNLPDWLKEELIADGTMPAPPTPEPCHCGLGASCPHAKP